MVLKNEIDLANCRVSSPRRRETQVRFDLHRTPSYCNILRRRATLVFMKVMVLKCFICGENAFNFALLSMKGAYKDYVALFFFVLKYEPFEIEKIMRH